MRILFYDFGDDYEPLTGGGGLQRHIHGLALTLTEYGHKVRVVNTRGSREQFPYEVMAASVFGLRQHLLWCDVAHLHGVRRPKLVLAALQCRLLGKPFVYTFHAYYDRARPSPGAWAQTAQYHLVMAGKAVWDVSLESAIHLLARATIILTPYWRVYMRERGMPVRKTVLVPNCIRFRDMAVGDRAGATRTEGAPSLISVSRLDPIKRLEDAIQALKCSGMEKAVLHLVGKGPDEARLQGVASAAGVAERVKFYGALSDSAVAELCAGADLFLLPSANEGLPTSLIEALARRLNVVASDIPGNRAVTEVAGVCRLHAVGNVPQLAAAILSARGIPVTDEAHARVAAAFSWECQARRLEAIYAGESAHI